MNAQQQVVGQSLYPVTSVVLPDAFDRPALRARDETTRRQP